ncbi:MAG TPA: DNA-binding domain-containing protein [Candidatus Obscuribacterales bacterium]
MSLDWLGQFQQDFVAAVLGGQDRSELLNQLVPIRQLSATEALDIYRRDYGARLSELLDERFAAIAFILGPEPFAALAWEFLGQHRSQHYDLGAFGQAFPAFLTAHPLSAEFPFLAELARLELASYELFHAPVTPAGDLTLFEQAPDPGRLRFELIAPLRLFASAWPLRELWKLRHQQTEPVLPEPTPQFLILYKNHQGVRTSLLSAAQFQLLQGLEQGLTLAAALDPLPQDAPAQLATEVSQLFALLSQEDLLGKLIL